MEETIELQDAIDSLYDIAVVQEKATSTLRLRKLAEFCVQELHLRGLVGVETEVTIDGGGREKNWDVVWQHHGKPRLAISLKSLLKNLSGTVPNRIDDLMGEMTNVQMYSPEIVAGYIMLFDVAKDTDDGTWCGLFRERLNRLSGRRGPAWSFGMVEESLMVEIDFSERARVLKGESDVSGFFDRLVAEVRVRNPDLIAAE